MNSRSLLHPGRCVSGGPLGPAAAFTMLEVLVALVIVGMIAAALSTAMMVAFKARKSAMQGLSNVRQARLALDIIGRDIQSTLPPTGILAGAFTSTPNDTGVDMDTLQLFDTAPPGPPVQGGADIQKVQITVMPESEILAAPVPVPAVGDQDTRSQGPQLAPPQNLGGDDMVLVRRVTRTLLAQVEPDPANQIVVRHVRAFTVRLYDGTDWLDTWDSTTQDNTLPLAVQVRLEINPDPAMTTTSGALPPQPYVMTRIFTIPCAAPAEQNASGSDSQGTSGTGGGSGGGQGGTGGSGNSGGQGLNF